VGVSHRPATNGGFGLDRMGKKNDRLWGDISSGDCKKRSPSLRVSKAGGEKKGTHTKLNKTRKRNSNKGTKPGNIFDIFLEKPIGPEKGGERYTGWRGTGVWLLEASTRTMGGIQELSYRQGKKDGARGVVG